jgi:hypothetical protein
MGTGIVSVALLLDGQRALSTVLLVLVAVMWVVLVVLLAARALADRQRFESDSRQPAALTAVAGTAVLGTRLILAGWIWAGTALLVIAAAIWVALIPRVLTHWQVPTVGASFILTVATESLALLSATIAFRDRTPWLVYAALMLHALGLCFYVLVLSHFQFRQLAIGAGDHWVTGGALAISTLAAGRIALAAQRTAVLGGAGAFKTLTLVLWCLTIVWLPALVTAEALYPRVSYNVRRWSTVFPVGMYAACSFVVGALTHTHPISDFARVWVWVALAVWLIVFGAMLARVPALFDAPRSP